MHTTRTLLTFKHNNSAYIIDYALLDKCHLPCQCPGDPATVACQGMYSRKYEVLYNDRCGGCTSITKLCFFRSYAIRSYVVCMIPYAVLHVLVLGHVPFFRVKRVAIKKTEDSGEKVSTCPAVCKVLSLRS